MHQALIIVTLLLLSPVVAARQSVSPGAVVDVLQRMQGKWKTECTADNDISRQQHLAVTFTHIEVSRTEFSDSECRLERQRLKTRFRFTLTEPIITQNGDRAFALNLIEEAGTEGSDAARLNLIRVAAGKLVLGDPEFSPTQKRPSHLDYRTVFTR